MNSFGLKTLLILIPLWLSACAHSKEAITLSSSSPTEDIFHLKSPALLESPAPYNIGTAQLLEDLKNLPQDATFYVNSTCATKRLLSVQAQKALDRKFNQHFFSPWHQSRASTSKKQAEWGFETYSKNLGFGENKREHSSAWLRQLAELAQLDSYPNTQHKAITITNTSLRVLPTQKPHFNNFNLAGEGYPFDNFQQSILWANMPLFVSHLSRDGDWAWVESALAPGWLAIEDLAFMDDDQIKQWETGNYVALIQDQVPILTDLTTFDKLSNLNPGLNPDLTTFDKLSNLNPGLNPDLTTFDKLSNLNPNLSANQFRFKTHIGAIFPKIGEDNQHYRILIAIPNAVRQAILTTGLIDKTVAAPKPLALMPSQLTQIINQLLNQPYGWGGLYENRDCSSTIHDLFTPFGTWLPRNSAAQAKTGQFISLQKLNPSEKEHLIIQKGIPYFTLLWVEGHIMLYIGTYHGQAMVFHNPWGIKTRDQGGAEGRKIIGQAVITTLRPGKELPQLDSQKGDILKNILGMTILDPISQQVCR